MIVTIKTYLNLRRRGKAKAWELAGMPDVGDAMVGIMSAAVVVVSVLYLISDWAN